MTSVLVLCTGNSCRSQMAEGFLNTYPGIVASSAGVEPASAVHPLAIRVMQEVGIDISTHQPSDVGEFVGQQFSFVITVCDNARERCPVFPMPPHRTLHMPFLDPVHATGTEEERLHVYRSVRDQIAEAMRAFAASVGTP